MTIYVDLVLIENMIMNYIILIATCIISKSEINIKKIVLASFIGGIYSIISYVVNFNLFIGMLFKVVLSVLIIRIVFIYKNIKILLKQLFMFYLTSFTFGGVAFMLLFFIRPENIIIKNNVLIGTYPIKIALGGGIIGFIIIFVVSIIIKNKFDTNNLIYVLEIGYLNKKIKIKTLIDSGNLLKDPITNMDVIIIEKDSLKKLLEEEYINEINNILKGKSIANSNMKLYNYKFKLIPFSSLGNENGMLIRI